MIPDVPCSSFLVELLEGLLGKNESKESVKTMSGEVSLASFGNASEASDVIVAL